MEAGRSPSRDQGGGSQSGGPVTCRPRKLPASIFNAFPQRKSHRMARLLPFCTWVTEPWAVPGTGPGCNPKAAVMAHFAISAAVNSWSRFCLRRKSGYATPPLQQNTRRVIRVEVGRATISVRTTAHAPPTCRVQERSGRRRGGVLMRTWRTSNKLAQAAQDRDRAPRRAERSRTRSRSCAACAERFEVHHGVRIQDAALVAAATLSHRYITDRFLPDKAIDFVDEAVRRRCAPRSTRRRRSSTRSPRRVTRLEIEEAALATRPHPDLRTPEERSRAGTGRFAASG